MMSRRVAYDSRAHGESEGDVCTYGFFEKRDLHQVLDSIGPGPIALVGTSRGAAVALQEAAEDARVAGGSLRGDVWDEIERWLENVLGPRLARWPPW